MSPILNDVALESLFLLCRVLWYSLRSLIKILRTDKANWAVLPAVLTYSWMEVLVPSLRGGSGHISTSKGNRNSLPNAAILRGISVSSIGALFQPYCVTLQFCRKVWWVPLSLPTIVCVLLRYRWYRSTLRPLWLPRDSAQNVIFSSWHISSNKPLNELPSSTTTTAHIPNESTTCSMNMVARRPAVMSKVGVDITNCVRSHIALSKCPF